MFGKKKNIAEQMTAAYETAHVQKDAGMKLLQLTALDKKITDLLANKQIFVGVEYFIKRGSAVGTLAGIGLVGSGIADIEGAGMILDYAGVGVISAFAGTVGSLFTGMALDDYMEKRLNNKRQFNYVANIVPHIPVLKALSLQIQKDKIEMTSEEQAPELQKSRAFREVLKAYPKLPEVFAAAQLKKPLPEIKRPVNNAAAEARQKKLEL